ncbi:MAG: tetratricopeptide repeat protein [Proteobacteria bacterium]|nr:tetratricopeptide repeat protein [Pseudomonadota bacterium]
MMSCIRNKTFGLLIGICSVMAIAACQPQQSIRANVYFETAEAAYRSGQYESAHQNYSAFLKQNPDPQLSRLAERRILAIEREIECVMGQKSGPRPAYVNQEEVSGTTPSQHPRVLYRSERPVRMPNYE